MFRLLWMMSIPHWDFPTLSCLEITQNNTNLQTNTNIKLTGQNAFLYMNRFKIPAFQNVTAFNCAVRTTNFK